MPFFEINFSKVDGSEKPVLAAKLFEYFHRYNANRSLSNEDKIILAPLRIEGNPGVDGLLVSFNESSGFTPERIPQHLLAFSDTRSVTPDDKGLAYYQLGRTVQKSPSRWRREAVGRVNRNHGLPVREKKDHLLSEYQSEFDKLMLDNASDDELNITKDAGKKAAYVWFNPKSNPGSRMTVFFWNIKQNEHKPDAFKPKGTLSMGEAAIPAMYDPIVTDQSKILCFKIR